MHEEKRGKESMIKRREEGREGGREGGKGGKVRLVTVVLRFR